MLESKQTRSMDWTLPATIVLVVGASIGALVLQRWSLNRAIRQKAERDAELLRDEEQ